MKKFWTRLTKRAGISATFLPFSLKELEDAVAAGHVTARTHPTDKSLVIYNYAPEVQFDNLWNEVTMNCRGLILRNGKIVARPFPKFFNLEELITTDKRRFISDEVYCSIRDRADYGVGFRLSQKVDGSLGIGYLLNGKPQIATRGSFVSDQAKVANSMLTYNGGVSDFIVAEVAAGRTPLFEIIYPENRIVVDYGGISSLCYITSIDIKTGMEVEVELPPLLDKVGRWDGWTLKDVLSYEEENSEGFVLTWDDGSRMKVKFDEYVRLHKVLTGMTPIKIWEMLSARMNINSMAQYVPDEFFVWVQSVADELNARFSEIESLCLANLSMVDRDASRAEQAALIKTFKHPGIVFSMLDGKDYGPVIWKMVRPTGGEVVGSSS